MLLEKANNWQSIKSVKYKVLRHEKYMHRHTCHDKNLTFERTV